MTTLHPREKFSLLQAALAKLPAGRARALPTDDGRLVGQQAVSPLYLPSISPTPPLLASWGSKSCSGSGSGSGLGLGSGPGSGSGKVKG